MSFLTFITMLPVSDSSSTGLDKWTLLPLLCMAQMQISFSLSNKNKTSHKCTWMWHSFKIVSVVSNGNSNQTGQRKFIGCVSEKSNSECTILYRLSECSFGDPHPGIKIVVRTLPLWLCISHICLCQLDSILHRGNHPVVGKMAVGSHGVESEGPSRNVNFRG